MGSNIYKKWCNNFYNMASVEYTLYLARPHILHQAYWILEIVHVNSFHVILFVPCCIYLGYHRVVVRFLKFYTFLYLHCKVYSFYWFVGFFIFKWFFPFGYPFNYLSHICQAIFWISPWICYTNLVCGVLSLYPGPS